MRAKLKKKLKINSYAINKMFKIVSFYSLKLCIKYMFIDYIVYNIQLIQNLTCILYAIHRLDFQST